MESQNGSTNYMQHKKINLVHQLYMHHENQSGRYYIHAGKSNRSKEYAARKIVASKMDLVILRASKIVAGKLNLTKQILSTLLKLS